nr:helix-turn-helix domain-containing protein [Pseudoalteromonas piscicida]
MKQDEVVSLYGGISLSRYKRWESGKSQVPFDDVQALVEQVFNYDLAKVIELSKEGACRG